MVARLFSRVAAFLRQEPLVHFFLAAALLWAARHIIGKEEINVSRQTVHGLRVEYENQGNRKASDAVMKRLIDDYVEDEVLYREALRSGLTHDNRVRALLVDTMRKSLRPVVPPPSDADLIKLRAEGPEPYQYPARASFEHVSFIDETRVPPDLLEKLRSGASTTGVGDAVRLNNPVPPTYSPQLEMIFGADFTAALMKCEPKVWSGPFKSQRGVHFVRVVMHEEAKEMPMDQVRTTLASQWTTIQENAAISRKVTELRNSYHIIQPKL